MKDFLSFKKMITPVFVQIFFWVGVLAIIVVGVLIIANGTSSGHSRYGYGGVPSWVGFVYLILGPIFWRVACESMILLFQIFESLHKIEQKLDKQE